MKKIIALGLLFTLTSFNVENADVYICKSKGSTKYHYKETCRGLNDCKHEIVRKSITDAKGLGLTLCGWED